MTSAVLAPFFEIDVPNNRPRLFAETLAEFGPVDVYTTAFDHRTKATRPDIQVPGIRRIEYVPSPPYSTNVTPARMWSHEVFAARAAARFLRRRASYDFVYANAPHSELALAAFAASRSRVKVLDVIDIWPDVLPFSDRFRRVARPALWAWRSLFDLSVASADGLLAVSDTFLAEAETHFRGDPRFARRIYIGGDKLPVGGAPKEDLFTIAYVGNIGHLYDFDALTDALSHPGLRGRVQVFVVGDGDRRRSLLETLALRGIPHQYFGSVYDPDEVGSILGRCHIGFNGYLNTSASFSYKATTYLSAGLPLLNSMGGDLWSLVERLGIGYNYAQGSSSELASRIADATDSNLGKMSENAMQFFERQIDHDVVKGKMRTFIEQIKTAKHVGRSA